MQNQHSFIDTVKKALGRNQKSQAQTDLFTTSPSTQELQILEKIKKRTAKERQLLLSRLAEVAGPLHVDLHQHKSLQETAAAIAALIQEKSPEWGTKKHVCRWDHPLVNRLELESLAQLQNIPIYTAPMPAATDGAEALPPEQKKQFRHQVEQSFIGITSADFCAVATATLALRSRPGHARSVSLVPSIHIAVIEEKQLLASLEELYTLLKWDPEQRKKGLTRNLSLISGPSKTGDIELIMVHGAHGPRELHIFVVSQDGQE